MAARPRGVAVSRSPQRCTPRVAAPREGPALAGVSRSSLAPRRTRGCPRAEPAVPAPPSRAPAQPSPACSEGGFPPPLSQLIPFTSRQTRGSALVPVSVRGRAQADRVPPAPGGVSPARCWSPSLPENRLGMPAGAPSAAGQTPSLPQNRWECLPALWGQTRSLLHKPPRATCQRSPAGYWPGGRGSEPGTSRGGEWVQFTCFPSGKVGLAGTEGPGDGAGRHLPCCGLRLAGACCQTGSGCAEMEVCWGSGVSSISILGLGVHVSHHLPVLRGLVWMQEGLSCKS